MDILYITPSYKPAYQYGGTTVVAMQLAESLAAQGHNITVYTTTANGKTELAVPEQEPLVVDGVTVYYFPRITKDHTHASPALWHFLAKTARNYDAIHIHSWWNFLVLGAVWVCYRQGIKPILSPHGMLSDYILNTNNRLKKKVIHALAGSRLLRNTFLHVSTLMEWNESKRINPQWEGQIIPNMVSLPDHSRVRSTNNVFTIGFLSRIDPKKGVDILIKALSAVSFPYRLKIAGNGDEAYIGQLKELAVSCKNDQYIEWVGWKNTEEKFDFFNELDLFVLPSHSENFAVVVIEALSVGTPVLVSQYVGLYTFVNDHDLGWITNTDPYVISEMLEKIVTEKEKIKRINEQAGVLIDGLYATAQITAQYTAFYQLVKEKNGLLNNKKRYANSFTIL